MTSPLNPKIKVIFYFYAVLSVALLLLAAVVSAVAVVLAVAVVSAVAVALIKLDVVVMA